MDFTIVRTNRGELYKPAAEKARRGWRASPISRVLRGQLVNLALVTAAYYGYRQFDYHGWVILNAGVRDLYLSIFG